jgi:uncharacterized protein
MDLTWIIKVSKFCNLRCAYCYEWNELGDRRRIPLDLWRKAFETIREHRERTARRHGRATTRIVFHGGEPLAAPMPYLVEVMKLRDQILGDDPSFVNAMQTNLYRLTDPMIAFLSEHRFEVGVSFDYVPGVRRTLAGNETEGAVIRNLDRLRAAGLRTGAITVLAKHTAPRITEIYDFFAARGSSLRVLPLLEGPSERPETLFAIDDDAIVASLKRLFDHWMDTGMKVRVAPFDLHMIAVLRKMVGVRGGMVDRRAHGETSLVLNTDGALYRIDDVYEDAARIGNLHEQTFDEIFASDRYARSLLHDEGVLAATCGECEYAGACSGWPVFTSKQRPCPSGRCTIAYRVNRFIEESLCELGFGRDELVAMLTSHYGVAAEAAA